MSEFILFTKQQLEEQSLIVLREVGRQIGVKAPTIMNKPQLIKDIMGIQAGEIEPTPPSNFGAPTKFRVDVSHLKKSENAEYENKEVGKTNFCDAQPQPEEFITEGYFEQVLTFGFVRAKEYETSTLDVFISQQNIKKYSLRAGDKVKAVGKTNKDGETAGALKEILSINGVDMSKITQRKNFDELVPYYPTERIKLESEGEENDLAIRCIDLFAPIGKGQRGLIVAPPKTGKTTIIKMIAKAIEKNNPEVKLIVLLIDERPEEVTDIRRSVGAEVVYSTFDEGAEHHVKSAELVIARAKRMVEDGKDVVILMDSITRLARAYNSTVESSGKLLSGGIDPVAMQGPKRFFGTARNIEDGGSLTILSTALIETGSRMDDVIFEEFKGTGNMEIHLSKELSEKRVFPAIDLYKSGTRKEELLLSEKELSTVYKLRKILKNKEDATDNLLEMMKKTKDNLDLADRIDAWLKLYK